MSAAAHRKVAAVSRTESFVLDVSRVSAARTRKKAPMRREERDADGIFSGEPGPGLLEEGRR